MKLKFTITFMLVLFAQNLFGQDVLRQKLQDNLDEWHKSGLVMKERPEIFDGSYQVTRITCEQLEY